MSDNYAVINGKRVELTDEQVKAISAESVEMKINPFNRMGLGSYYYAPHYDGTVRTFTWDIDIIYTQFRKSRSRKFRRVKQTKTGVILQKIMVIK